MNRWQAMVHEFHEATNSAIGTDPGLQHNELRAKLIMEEAVETVAALGFSVHALIDQPGIPGERAHREVASFHKSFAEPDFLEVIDGLCDLIYVIAGTGVTAGVDLDPHFTEVHKCNMMKLLGPKRADGKQLKPEGWQPPDHARVLAEAQSGELPWSRLSPHQQIEAATKSPLSS